MIQAKCIQKFRDKQGKIYGYRLMDNNEHTIDIESDKLKAMIRNKEISVINLTLTSDNRIIDGKENKSTNTCELNNKKHNTQNKKSLNTIIENVIAKSKALGIPLNEVLSKLKGFNTETIYTPDGCCYLYSHIENTENTENYDCVLNPRLSDKNIHIVYIPDNIQNINSYWIDAEDDTEFTNTMQELHGKIVVIGGSNISDTTKMFCKCPAKYIDLSYFNTANVIKMNSMFKKCEAIEINLKHLNTSNVVEMNSMFHSSNIQYLDLSSFNTENLTEANSMFAYCEALIYIDLSSFKFTNYCDIDNMFYDCYAEIKATEQQIIEVYEANQ